MKLSIRTLAFGAVGAISVLGAFAPSAASATTVVPPIHCQLAGSPTPVIGANGIVSSAATAVCSTGTVAPFTPARTSVLVKVTLHDNQAHTQAVKGVSAVNVTTLSTGSAVLPAIAGHSYGSIVELMYQRTANTGAWTTLSWTFTGPRAGPQFSVNGLSWNGLRWNGLSWDVPTLPTTVIS